MRSLVILLWMCWWYEGGHGGGEDRHSDGVGLGLVERGDGRTGEGCGGCAVGGSLSQALGGGCPRNVAEEVTGQGRISSAHGASGDDFGPAGEPGAVGGDEYGARCAEGGEHGAHAACDQRAGGRD